MPDHTTRRIGRRGAALLILAAVWALIGYSSVIAGVNVPDTIYYMIPAQVRGVMWFGAVAFAVFYALRRDADWPAWAAMTLPIMIRSISGAWGWVTWHLTGGAEGSADGWAVFAIYALMAGLCLVLSGWKEPVPRLGTVPVDEPNWPLGPPAREEDTE